MAKKIFIFLVVNSITIYLVDQLLDDFTVTGSIWAYLLIGLVIGVLNTFLKPALRVLSLPLLFLTAGLFSIVINAMILYLGVLIIDILQIPDLAFTIEGIFTYIIAAFIIGLLNYLFQKILKYSFCNFTF
jgi:putative membrane protein